MSSPALTSDTFRAVGRSASAADVMTLGGTILKTGVLLAILIAAGAVSWYVAVPASGAEAFGGLAIALAIGGSLGGLVLAIVTIFNPRFAPVTAPLYAVAEGLLLGVVSAMFEQMFRGLVMQAILLTLGVLTAMLFLYATRIIQPTRYFILGVTAATCGIALFYLVAMVLSLFGIQPDLMRQMMYGNGVLGIGFSLFVVGIAALNLVLDFNLIEQGAASGAPKYMEWYGGFSLLVTLVWLYLEVLRLLAKLRSR